MVVSIELDDVLKYQQEGSLAGLYFQQEMEQRACELAGNTQTAPGQRLVDYIQHKTSSSLPSCSYIPGVKSIDLNLVLGKDISRRLREGLKYFLQQKPGLNSNEAILVATESRTSTPVRIPRLKDSLQHPQIKGLFPCGEGAGYAGGIVSAAMDGIACAEMIEGMG
jgi:uncharacterized FAD-dependent dehydrogenase